MTEVFSTNIEDHAHAVMIARMIRNVFPDYLVNFDLDDCDHILRIQAHHSINVRAVMKIVRFTGFNANILPDEIPVAEPSWPVL